MYNDDTELLFPARLIPMLADLRGEHWKHLIASLADKGEDEPDILGLVLTMVRLGGCASCNADSFRAMRGCTQCARQTIRRFRGTDLDLVREYEENVRQLRIYQNKSERLQE